VTVCNTGQHRELVPPLLTTFGLVPEVELGVMNPGQSLSMLTARLLDGLDPVLDALRFDWVVVQGTRRRPWRRRWRRIIGTCRWPTWRPGCARTTWGRRSRRRATAS
jgi:hypothetical protein